MEITQVTRVNISNATSPKRSSPLRQCMSRTDLMEPTTPSPTRKVPSMNPLASPWQPVSPPPPYSSLPPTPLRSTALFETVRAQFISGLSTMENLIRFMERWGPSTCRSSFRRGIDNLLDNLLTLSKWLVNFLIFAKESSDEDTPWTISNITGVKIELHEYSWKVLRIVRMLEGSRMAVQSGRYFGPHGGKDIVEGWKPPVPPKDGRPKLMVQTAVKRRETLPKHPRGIMKLHEARCQLDSGLVC